MSDPIGVMQLALDSRSILDAVEALDEKALTETIGRGVVVQDNPLSTDPAYVKSSRVILERFELLLRFKRDLAKIDKLSPAEEAQADKVRSENICGALRQFVVDRRAKP